MKRPAFAAAVVAVCAFVPTAHAETKLPTCPQGFPFCALDPQQQAAVGKLAADAQQIVVNELARAGIQVPPPPVPPPAPTTDGLVDLPVPGFGSAVVSVPRGASVPKPVLVVGHGNHDNPAWECPFWREVVGDRGFVLCIRGKPIGTGGDTFTHGAEFPKEVDAATAALRARYGLLVDPGPMMYAGFSQGAYYGATLVQRNAARFPRAIIVEGGWGGWTSSFRKSGGQRVLFACGQSGCAEGGQTSVKALEKGGAAGRVVYAPGAGHTYGGAVGDQIKAQWGWMIEGDPRWFR